MITSALRLLVNNLFLKSFNNIFMENKKIIKILIVFYFLIKTLFK